MGNMGSIGSDIKEQSKIDLSYNEASSSRPQITRKISQSIHSKNAKLNMSSQGRRISALALSQRQIVKGCIDKAKDDIAERIYRRVIEKRDDFRKFVEALSEEQRCKLASALRNFLKNVVSQLTDRIAVQRISEDFGAQHVQYRSFGFRPDFFAVIADAVTTECVLLDFAIHPASEALFAWSTLTTFMFSSVRDGYYNEQRRVRKASQQYTNRSKILLHHASIDIVRHLDNEQKNSSILYNYSSEYDAGEMDELEMNKSTTKRMEEENGPTTERVEISDIGKESKNSPQAERKMIFEKKFMIDVYRQLLIALHIRHNSTC